MAWTTPATVAPLDTLSASFWNEQVRDNLNALDAAGANAVGFQRLATQTYTNVSEIIISNVFSSAYDSYRLVISNLCLTTDSLLRLRFRTGTTEEIGASYNRGSFDNSATSASITAANENNAQHYTLGRSRDDFPAAFFLDIALPAVAQRTYMFSYTFDGTGNFWSMRGAQLATTTAYDGFRLFASSGNITGKVSVFGYVN